MVKVIDPDGIIIGVYETANDVPKKIPNRFYSFYYRKSDCQIIEVTDKEDYDRLLPSMTKP